MGVCSDTHFTSLTLLDSLYFTHFTSLTSLHFTRLNLLHAPYYTHFTTLNLLHPLLPHSIYYTHFTTLSTPFLLRLATTDYLASLLDGTSEINRVGKGLLPEDMADIASYVKTHPRVERLFLSGIIMCVCVCVCVL